MSLSKGENGQFLDMYAFGLMILVILSEENEKVLTLLERAEDIYRRFDTGALRRLFKKEWDVNVHILIFILIN